MAEAVVQLDVAQAGEIIQSQILSSDDEVDTSSDLEVKVRAQFENISCMLVETGKSLSCFEDVLGHYQQVAEIRPLGTTDEEKDERAKDERAGEGAADEVRRLREENMRLRERNAALEERCSTLDKKASTLT